MRDAPKPQDETPELHDCEWKHCARPGERKVLHRWYCGDHAARVERVLNANFIGPNRKGQNDA
ncbi:MAG: hypothetical protein ACRD4R_06685 [Candidatus Acidiferrales bacterium]